MRLFKHTNNSDVAADFLRVVHVKEGRKVTVSWWNIVNSDNVFPLGLTEEVIIKDEDWLKWKPWPPWTAREKNTYGIGEGTLAGNDRDL